MKHKFHIWKNVKGKKLLIQEYAVLSANASKKRQLGLQDDDFSLLCEQSYNAEAIKKAASTGKQAVISLLRNQHFFPIGLYIEVIADSVIEMYTSKGEKYQNLIIDDKDVLLGDLAESDVVREIEAEGLGESTDNLAEFTEEDEQFNENVLPSSTGDEQYDEEEDY